MAAGARAYLTKPIEVTEFFRVIEQTTSNGNGNGQVALDRKVEAVQT